ELLKGVYLRYRHQIIAAGIAHKIFNQSLRVSLPGIAEAALEEVVATKGDEGLLLLGPVPRQGSHHHLRHAVIPDVAGHTAEEVEGLFMALEEGLLLLVRRSAEERHLGEA